MSGVSFPIYLHLAGAAPALVLGGVQLIRVKGDRRHRLIGRIWVGLMALSVLASFAIYTDGRPSIIHAISLWTAISLVMGIRNVRRGDTAAHKGWMGGACIGLFIAFALTFQPDRLMYRWFVP